MDTLRLILLFVHVLGFAALLGFTGANFVLVHVHVAPSVAYGLLLTASAGVGARRRSAGTAATCTRS